MCLCQWGWGMSCVSMFPPPLLGFPVLPRSCSCFGAFTNTPARFPGAWRCRGGRTEQPHFKNPQTKYSFVREKPRGLKRVCAGWQLKYIGFVQEFFFFQFYILSNWGRRRGGSWLLEVSPSRTDFEADGASLAEANPLSSQGDLSEVETAPTLVLGALQTLSFHPVHLLLLRLPHLHREPPSYHSSLRPGLPIALPAPESHSTWAEPPVGCSPLKSEIRSSFPFLRPWKNSCCF